MKRNADIGLFTKPSKQVPRGNRLADPSHPWQSRRFKRRRQPGYFM